MIYASIDIGSDTIKVIVAENNDSSIHILASTNTKVVGIKKGIITDKDMVCKSLILALEEIKKQIGLVVDKAIVSIPCYNTSVEVYNGEVYTDGIITGDDVINCFKSAIQGNIDDDMEVATVHPIDFLVDDEDKYADPKGVNGYKLESRVLVSTLPKEYVYSYLEIFESCHVEVIDIALGPVCDYANMDNVDIKRDAGALVNIGDSKTEISIFNKGLMVKADILPLGSRKIDQDIKYIYNLDRITAKYLKENVAVATSEYATDEFTFECENVLGDKKEISQVEVSEIVEARLEEILKSVKNSLNALTNRKISYIIITGGVSNLSGFNYLVENYFGDKAYVINMNTIGIRNNIYATCFGLIKYYCDKLSLRGIAYTMYEKNINNDYSDLINKIQDFVNNS